MLEEGSIYSNLFRLAVPAMITVMLAQSAYIIDTIFIAIYDKQAVPIMTLSQPVTMFGLIIPFTIVAGIAPLISRKLGEKDSEKSRKYFMSALLLSSILTIIYITLMFMFNSFVFRDILSVPENLFEMSKNYIFPLLVSQIFYTNVIVMEQASLAQGDTFRIMVINFFSALINIILNLMFLTMTPLGLFGVGLATIISTAFKFFIYTYIYSKGKQTIKFIKGFLFDKEFFGSLGSSSFAAFGMASLTIIAMLINNRYITLADNRDVLLVTKTMMSIIFSFSISFMIGIMQTTQSFIAFNFGAKNYVRMKKSAWIGLGYSLLFALILSIVLITFKTYIADFFKLSADSKSFNITIYSTAISLFAMPTTFLVTSLARSSKNNKVLFYHQWITNGLVILLVNIFFPMFFPEYILPALRSISQIVMLIFVIPSYIMIFRSINKSAIN